MITLLLGKALWYIIGICLCVLMLHKEFLNKNLSCTFRDYLNYCWKYQSLSMSLLFFLCALAGPLALLLLWAIYIALEGDKNE